MRKLRRLAHRREAEGSRAAGRSGAGAPSPAGCGLGASGDGLNGVVPLGPEPAGPICWPRTGTVSTPGATRSVTIETGPPTVLDRYVASLVLTTSWSWWPVRNRYTMPGSSIVTGLVTSGTRTAETRLRGSVVVLPSGATS